ncbi:MAG: S1C family serine protease [Pirellulales bacterium]
MLDESGLVVTCHHCVEDGAQCTVTFSDGRQEHITGVRGAWPDRDIAIVRISTLRPVVPLALESRSPKKGEPVVAFGAPEGLSFSVSEGSVSALRNGDEVSEILSRPPYNVVRGSDIFHLAGNTSIVQITAAIMPGSSGGPVVNFSGNVVGISAFVLRHDGQQFGFCISAEDIRRAAESLGDDDLTWPPKRVTPAADD